MISPINYIYSIHDYVYGLMTGLFAWIRLTVLSRTYFIECFTTTCLLTHHSLLAKTGLMRMIDEDEVYLKEQPEDNRYITLCHYWELQTRKHSGSSLPGGSWEGVKAIHRHTTYHRTSLPGL